MIVVSEIGGLVEVVNDGVNGVLHKPSEDSLFNGIMRIIKDQEMAQTMAINGYKHVVKAHSRTLWRERMNMFFTNGSHT